MLAVTVIDVSFRLHLLFKLITSVQSYKTFFAVIYAHFGKTYADIGVNYAIKFFVTLRSEPICRPASQNFKTWVEFFYSRVGHMDTIYLICFLTKRSNLMLKSRPEQHVDNFP